MGFKVFWTCFDDFCFSRSPNPLHYSMYKVWGEKNRKIFFCFLCSKNDFKRVLTCFDDFWFSRSPNPLHDYMYKVWAKKIENFFLFLML
jgi:hypothetical protein